MEIMVNKGESSPFISFMAELFKLVKDYDVPRYDGRSPEKSKQWANLQVGQDLKIPGNELTYKGQVFFLAMGLDCSGSAHGQTKSPGLCT